MKILKHLLVILVLSASFNSSADPIATLRHNTEIKKQQEPAQIATVVNKDIKQKRNYPMQPPIIPHHIRNYEINLNSNKCMSCHSRNRTEESQAPMVSVTHFMNRDGNFLAEISPRRYFCTQCHVTQTDVKALIKNDFKDMNSLMKEKTTKPIKK